jgi:phosphoglycolate phosphatase
VELSSPATLPQRADRRQFSAVPPPLVIFDLDGTLVDSAADIALHLGDALVAHGLARPDVGAITTWIGHGARDLCARAIAEAGAAPTLIEPVLGTLRTRYAARPVVTTALYPGLAALLDELTAAAVPLAVLSNKPMPLTRAVAAALLGAWPWRAVVGEQPDTPPKPSPDAALAIAAAVGAPCAATVLVGDSEIDVACAAAAGMRAVAVSWGQRSPAALQATGAEVVHDVARLRARLMA